MHLAAVTAFNDATRACRGGAQAGFVGMQSGAHADDEDFSTGRGREYYTQLLLAEGAWLPE